MPDFVNPLQGLAQGVQGGLQLGMQMDQMRQQRRAREWEQDIRAAGLYMDYANTKGATDATRANAINQVNTILGKYYPAMQLPTIAPDQIPDYAKVLKQGSDLIKTLEKEPGKFDFVVGEWGRANADWAANAGRKAELSETHENARKQVTETLKTIGDSQKSGGKGPKAPDDVLKEMFELNKTMAGVGKLDANSAMMIGLAPDSPMAKALSEGRVDPEMMGQLRGLAAKRMQSLNESLPEGKKLQAISPQEYEALVKSGHSPEEVLRSAFVVPGQ